MARWLIAAGVALVLLTVAGAAVHLPGAADEGSFARQGLFVAFGIAATAAYFAAVALVLAYVVDTRRHFFSVVIASRLQTGGSSTSAHFAVYSFIPHVLQSNPLLGLGLNTFSVYYEFVTGKTNWGPHSYWVALIVETGLVGALLFLVFLRYVFLRLRAARTLGRALDRAGNPLGARVRPLAWGMTAALAGTMAANFFYLTMQFYYFYGFVALALALPVVFARARACSR